MLNQAHVRHWIDPQRAASQASRADDEIDIVFAEIRTVALELPFRERIVANDKALLLELLVEMNRIKRLVGEIEREFSA